MACMLNNQESWAHTIVITYPEISVSLCVVLEYFKWIFTTVIQKESRTIFGAISETSVINWQTRLSL